MGSSQSIIIEDLREILRDIRRRLAFLEEENATMRKQITNMKDEHVFKSKLLEEGRSLSVRQPKGSRSLFTK